jgi:choline dehydrogenase-like flavoprotein
MGATGDVARPVVHRRRLLPRHGRLPDGRDPASSVVDRGLRVHDTPGLSVFGGATFPTCPGINPTLTIWAASLLTADRLVERMRTGEA